MVDGIYILCNDEIRPTVLNHLVMPDNLKYLRNVFVSTPLTKSELLEDFSEYYLFGLINTKTQIF